MASSGGGVISFGLLHGFGFAVVLQELGLPQTMKLEALLFFNIGVELGQLLFIFAVLGVSAVILKLVLKQSYRYQIVQLGIYMIGVCSAFSCSVKCFFDGLNCTAKRLASA